MRNTALLLRSLVYSVLPVFSVVVSRVAPSAVVRKLFPPPKLPKHVAQRAPSICRMWGFHSTYDDHTRWRIAWQNSLSAAQAAWRSHPDDEMLEKHCSHVVALHSGLFRTEIGVVS